VRVCTIRAGAMRCRGEPQHVTKVFAGDADHAAGRWLWLRIHARAEPLPHDDHAEVYAAPWCWERGIM
jgi:hypothetical protein